MLHDGGRAVLGMSDAALDRAVDRAALLLNVNGFVQQERVLERVPLRAYLDIDPGFGQMWRALDLHDPFAGHDAFVTIGERIGQPGCTIPTNGLDWVTTPQPVVLEEWPAQAPGEPGAHPGFTSVASWRGPFAPIEYEGVTYGLRVHEFRRFADLPAPHIGAPRGGARHPRGRDRRTWSCCARTDGIWPTRRRRRPIRGPTATTCSARRGS